VGQRGSQHVVTQQLVSSSPDEIVVTWTSRPSWARRTAHFDVFTADSTGSYTVEQNFLEINTELNTLCLEPGDCDTYTTWAMNAHAGDGVNDLKTDVQMTRVRRRAAARRQ
jgi:hypothetical protein